MKVLTVFSKPEFQFNGYQKALIYICKAYVVLQRPLSSSRICILFKTKIAQ